MKLAVRVRCVVVKSQLENNVFSHIVCCIPYFFFKKNLRIVAMLIFNILLYIADI